MSPLEKLPELQKKQEDWGAENAAEGALRNVIDWADDNTRKIFRDASKGYYSDKFELPSLTFSDGFDNEFVSSHLSNDERLGKKAHESLDQLAFQLVHGRIGTELAETGSSMEQIIKGDRNIAVKDAAAEKLQFTSILLSAGLPLMTARLMADQTMEKFTSKSPEHLEGSPEEQLARINRALIAILSGDRGPADPLRPDAKLRSEPRHDLVKDFANRLLWPEKFVKQGFHNTCALQSIQNQALSGRDPARLAEMLAGIANNGYAEVINPYFGSSQIVEVDPSSIMPEPAMARYPFLSDPQESNVRGTAGQVLDALFGQIIADNMGILDGKEYKFFTSNAISWPRNNLREPWDAKDRLFEVENGEPIRMVSDNPEAGVNELAILSKSLDLPPGSLFMDAIAERHVRMPFLKNQYVFFQDAEELRKGLSELKEKFDTPGAMYIDAAKLPGTYKNSAREGIFAHEVTVKLRPNGDVSVDNSWANLFDMDLTIENMAYIADWAKTRKLPAVNSDRNTKPLSAIPIDIRRLQ